MTKLHSIFQRISDFIWTKEKSNEPGLFTPADDDPAYVKERLKPSIRDFQKEKRTTIRREQNLQLIVIIASALIPIANVSLPPSLALNVLSSVLGAIALVVTSILQLKKYHEKWILSKTTAAKLMNEYYSWKNKVRDYTGSDDAKRLALLVRNCEFLLLSEATQFVDIFQPRDSTTGTPTATTTPTTSIQPTSTSAP
jgi:Protein of unknown function (DUF4231)